MPCPLALGCLWLLGYRAERGRGKAKERERVKEKVRGKVRGEEREALSLEVGSQEVVNLVLKDIERELEGKIK